MGLGFGEAQKIAVFQVHPATPGEKSALKFYPSGKSQLPSALIKYSR